MFFMMTILFSSCVTEHYYIDINKDGGSILCEQILAKSTYDQLISMGSDPSSFTSEGGKISFFTEDNVEYAKLSMEKEYSSLSNLKDAIASLGTASEENVSDPSENYFTAFDIVLNTTDDTFIVSGTFNTFDGIDSVYTKCTLSFVMPGDILSYNVGSKTESNTVTIDMLQAWSADSDKDFTIIAEASSNILLLIILIGAIVIVVGLATFAIILITINQRKRNQSNTMQYASSSDTNQYSTGAEMATPEVTPIDEPEDYYVDENGNTYYLDEHNNPYYIDDNGHPFYIDGNGNPFYIDNNGNPFYVNEDGIPFYVDENGKPFYIGEDGNPYYFTEE